MADLAQIFGDGKISYDEFVIKAGEMGVEFGDTGEMRERYEEEIRSIRFSNALERELDRSGVKNRDLVTKIIDMNSVTVDGDGVHGIAEQIDGLRESDPYLFMGADDEMKVKKQNSGIRHGSATLDPDRLSDREFYKKIKLM